MDEKEVGLLAQYENLRWTSRPGTRTASQISDQLEARRSTGEHDTADSGHVQAPTGRWGRPNP